MLLTWLAPLVLLAPDTQEQPASPAPVALEEVAAVGVQRLDGTEVPLAELVGDGPLVLPWTGVGCPISGKLAPRLQRLAERFAAQDVSFVGVNANPQDTLAKMAKEVEELGLSFPVVRDFRQALTRRLGARTTTEVFLFDEEGVLAYRGAVDDQYAVGAAKPAPTKNYLVEAIEAVLAGERPATEETEAPGCLLTVLPEEELPEAVTWSRDIAPIVQQNCETCHRPGQVGPFALQTYDEAKGWARMIASVVKERRMPPWNATPEFDGHFVNERRLTNKERDKILKWVADGMPRGNPDEDPKPLVHKDGWRIGQPDAVVQPTHWMHDNQPLPETGYAVEREGTIDYRYFVAETNFPEDRWIRAMEILPGEPDVVHHVVVGVWDKSKGGFREDDLLGYLAVAVPGDTPSIFPDGYAKLLPKGATLVFQMHYTPNGKERHDVTRLGMVFAEEPPIFEVRSEAMIDTSIRIPAGADHHEVRGSIQFEEETGLLSLFPHMHMRGKDFRYVLHYPDGETEELLSVDYDFNWQESYIYEDPKLIPAGARIECIAHFDNSDANPNNPDPNQVVYWGDQSWQEMFVGYWDRVVPLDL